MNWLKENWFRVGILVIVGTVALILAVGFLFSQYIQYKQFRLSQETAVQDCIDEAVGGTRGFRASLEAQKCMDKLY